MEYPERRNLSKSKKTPESSTSTMLRFRPRHSRVCSSDYTFTQERHGVLPQLYCTFIFSKCFIQHIVETVLNCPMFSFIIPHFFCLQHFTCYQTKTFYVMLCPFGCLLFGLFSAPFFQKLREAGFGLAVTAPIFVLEFFRAILPLLRAFQTLPLILGSSLLPEE